MSERGEKQSQVREQLLPARPASSKRTHQSQSIRITQDRLDRSVITDRGEVSNTRRREGAGLDASLLQAAAKEALDESLLSVDSQLTMKSVAGQFRRPVKVTFPDLGASTPLQQLVPEKVRDKLEKTLKLQKEMRHKHEFKHEFEEPRPFHDRNAIQELAQLAKAQQSRDAATMIHQVQQEMMEKYLPNNKFTKEVVFYDDYIFILEDKDPLLDKNTFEE